MEEIVPADGISTANWRERGLRYVRVFWQLSDKPPLVRRRTMGASETKHKSYGERLDL